MKKGIIFVEGEDGSGKSTFCRRLQSFIQGFDGGDVDLISFPTEEAKALIRKTAPSAEIFLSDIGSTLLKNLSSPNWLVCDRSFLSTMAYQNVGVEVVSDYIPLVVLELPIIVIWLDWPVPVLLENLGHRRATGSLSGIGFSEATDNLQARLTDIKGKYEKAWGEWTAACRMKSSKRAIRVNLKAEETFDKAIDRFIKDEVFSLIRSLGVTI